MKSVRAKEGRGIDKHSKVELLAFIDSREIISSVVNFLFPLSTVKILVTSFAPYSLALASFGVVLSAFMSVVPFSFTFSFIQNFIHSKVVSYLESPCK